MKTTYAVLTLILLSLFSQIKAQSPLDGAAVNFSIRAELNEKPLIHGLAIEGTQLVLFRAVGQSLSQFDVTTPIDDPFLILFDSEGNEVAQSMPIAQLSESERAILNAASEATGAFSIADDSKEAVIIYPISGPATLHAESISGKKGEILIEAYILPQDSIEPSDKLTGTITDQYHAIQPLDPTTWEPPLGPEDDFEIGSAELTGSTLSLAVSYGGGCRTHEFELYYSSAFLESNPPQAEIYLRHNGNEDPCEAIVGDQLIFNIDALVDQFKAAYPNSPVNFSIRLNKRIDGNNSLHSMLAYQGLQTITWHEDELPDAPEDHYQINNAVLDGTTLSVSTSYSGGCAKHEFKLLALSSDLEAEDNRVRLFLVHNGNDDPCDAYPSETIQFDLSQLLVQPAFVAAPNYTIELYTRIDGVSTYHSTLDSKKAAEATWLENGFPDEPEDYFDIENLRGC